MTLLELILVLAITGALLLFGSSVGSRWLERQRCRQATYRLARFIDSARSLATVHGPLVLRPSKDVWDGAVLLLESERTHRIVRRLEAFDQGSHLKWNGFYRDDWMRFSMRLDENVTNGRFELARDKRCSVIIVNRLGRVRTEWADQ